MWIASYLANETNCMNINLLHLSSRKAVEAAWTMQQVFPHIAFRREVTVGHLLLDTDCECAVHAKVNPPIRPREDVEALWQAVLDRKIDWIVSDHACCSAEQKWSKDDPDNIWLAKSGFGGTEYLLSGVVSEGSKRGLSYNRMAELLSWNPSRRFGLLNKGDIAPGFDADIVLVDPHETFTVRAADSESGRVFAVRGSGTQRPREEHVPARSADLSQRRCCRPGARPIPASADQIEDCGPRRGERPHELKPRAQRGDGHCDRNILLLNAGLGAAHCEREREVAAEASSPRAGWLRRKFREALQCIALRRTSCCRRRSPARCRGRAGTRKISVPACSSTRWSAAATASNTSTRCPAICANRSSPGSTSAPTAIAASTTMSADKAGPAIRRIT